MKALSISRQRSISRQYLITIVSPQGVNNMQFRNTLRDCVEYLKLKMDEYQDCDPIVTLDDSLKEIRTSFDITDDSSVIQFLLTYS